MICISREIYQSTKVDTTRWINLIIHSKLFLSFCGHGSLHIWPSHLLILFLQFYIIMDILFWVAISLQVMLKIIVQSKMAFSVWPEIVTSQKILGEYIFQKFITWYQITATALLLKSVFVNDMTPNSFGYVYFYYYLMGL